MQRPSKSRAAQIAIAVLIVGWIPTAIAACDVGPGLSPSGFDVFVCMKTSQTAKMRDQPAPDCVGPLRSNASVAMDKAKTCLKKQRNGEGLRALGEFWAAWTEFINAMDDDKQSEKAIEFKFQQAQIKYNVFDVVN